MRRLALIADIHSNASALEAVLADIRHRGVDQIYDLGDVAQGSLAPAETIHSLREAGIPSLRGNADRLLMAPEPSPGYEADFALAHRTLSPTDWDWLAAQPPHRRVGNLFLCHGTPSSDTEALLETIRPTGARLANDDELTDRLKGLEGASLIAVGHTHVPRLVRLYDGRVCVNPGSVGLPAYEDDQPLPHVMEAGSPHARYALVGFAEGTWQIEHIAVPYDWHAAAAAALEAGRADRAHWLRTGRARAGTPAV